MAVSTSATSPLALLFLHRGTANPRPAVLSFPPSLRGASLRSRAAAAPPAETLSDQGIPDAPPEGEGTAIPLPSSIGEDGEQLTPKLKITIELRSYWMPLIEDSCQS
uniref:Uncharacterized protein n=1 Tax=Paspalum vaginatum TaxID=158149 RepID=A0A140GYN1_9POAL|nr:hypothetical protein [Paspalum vaginatum]